MRGPKVTFAVLAVLLAAVVGFGCGGDDGSESALTKAEFIQQADRICKQGEARIEVEAEEFGKKHGSELATEAHQKELVTDVVVPGLQAQAAKIADLEAPDGDEETVEEMIEAVEKGAAELEANPLAGMEGKAPLADASKIARAYGLEECGSEG